jgi:hypothetical protein
VLQMHHQDAGKVEKLEPTYRRPIAAKLEESVDWMVTCDTVPVVPDMISSRNLARERRAGTENCPVAIVVPAAFLATTV